MKDSASILVSGLCLVLAAPCEAAAFSDTTFNLTDYTITKSLQSGTATVSQSASGNPGTALLVDFVVPAPPPFTTSVGNVYYLNNGFTYDPGSSGAFSSITFSLDRNITIVSPANFAFGNGQSFLIFQAGNFYSSGVSLPSIQGVYQTASETATFNDFSLIVDMATGAVNSLVHPSFSTGLMEFGFRNGFGVPAQTAAEARILQDNFSVTLTPAVGAVPEPETYALVLAGLALLTLKSSSRRRERSD